MVGKHGILHDTPAFDFTTSVDSLATVGSTRHLLDSEKTSNIKLYSVSNHVHSTTVLSQCPAVRNGHVETRQQTANSSKLFQEFILNKRLQQKQKLQNQPPERHASISYTESSTFSDEMCMQIQENRERAHVSKGILDSCHAFKNLIILSLSFMLLFTAFISLQTLQSSLHATNYTGVISLSCYYGATLLSCFIAPAILAKLTSKGTICLGFGFYLLHITSHFHPAIYVLVPSSLLLGALTGPLWSAQSTYLTTLAISYAQASGQVIEVALSSFNGIFFGFLQTSQVWGNLLSASVLGSDNDTVLLNQVNGSVVKAACGARDCGLWDEFPSNALPHQLPPVPTARTHILLIAYLALVLVGLLLNALFLSKTAIHSSGSLRSISLSSHQLFFTSIRMFCDRRLQLLSPLVVYTGLHQGFVLGDFTKSYVNCALGIHKLGYVMVCFGAVSALCSVAIGHVVKHIKRYYVMIAGTLFSVGLFVVLVKWRPHMNDPPMFYVMAACLGLCDAIWQTQTNAMFGLLFKDQPEAAFSCYRMLQCLGFSVTFGLGAILCVSTKVYMMCAVLGLAILTYAVVERQLILLRRRKDSATIVML